MRILKLASLALALSASQLFAADLITKQSAHSVSVTLDRLAAAVEGAGATVFARIDHAKGAASFDMDLRPTQMLMFGSPKMGAPAMLQAQSIGLDLPLRVVAYEDADGKVFVAYHAPAEFSEEHDIAADAGILAKMTGALDKLTNKATAE